MNIIRTQKVLEGFCTAAASRAFLCADTEFIHEKTFFARLCLIQAATPETEVIIDPLQTGLDLVPFLELLSNPGVVKVMHAARQDMGIFYQINGKVPAPLFDTQVAAMALGYGPSTGYATLVKGRLKRDLDKNARLTDWAHRPLSREQLSYALGDVTHLRDMYPDMRAELENRGRLQWVMEEMGPMLDPKLYENVPERAWEGLRLRSSKRPYLAALKAAAAWRERRAIKKDVPRRHILGDDALHVIATQQPGDLSTLARARGVPDRLKRSRAAGQLVQDIRAALENIDGYAPEVPAHRQMPPNLGPLVEMLRTLLRLRTEYQDIAPLMVASARDIEQIAAFGDEADVPALRGWRREVFGEDALALLKGQIAMRLENGEVVAERISS